MSVLVLLRCAACGALILSSLLAFGCNPIAERVASQIFGAPNKRPRTGLEFSPEVQAAARSAYSHMFDVPVRSARLRVAVIDPGEAVLQWKPKIKGGHVWTEGPISLTYTRSDRAPKGLLVMLHGFGCGKEQMLPWAVEFATAGYRVALVDLRGHGDSTGDWVGFGALEKNDLKLVLDDLDSRGLGGLPVGILGVSYGASVGLKFAALDSRVRAVVALEPFSSADRGIPELARAAFPEAAARISDRMFSMAFSIGAAKGVFNWSDTQTENSVGLISYPILFIHGGADSWLSPDHSRRLLKRAPAGSRLLLVEDQNHVSLPLDVALIAPEIRTWFAQNLEKQSSAVALAHHATGGQASM